MDSITKRKLEQYKAKFDEDRKSGKNKVPSCGTTYEQPKKEKEVQVNA